MNFWQYQQRARSTAIYPRNLAVVYPALGLAGEAGETVDKIKKVLRDKGGHFDGRDKVAITKELGDVLWYIANIAADLNISMQEIAEANLQKLEDRKNRDALRGQGDNR